jgi:hypothetical protein
VNGVIVPVESFKEAFPHHILFVNCVAHGMTASLPQRGYFRDFVRGRHPTASFPHGQTIQRLTEVMAEAIQRAQRVRIKDVTTEHKQQICYGVQMDMWTNTETRVSYVCKNLASAHEHTSVRLRSD